MVLESINFHFWPYCNFKCKYCFARFESSNLKLSFNQCIKIINDISNAGIKKINFAGGEPSLSPFLGDLLKYSKNLGLITSIISNGTGITKNFLKEFSKSIDWIGLSIDSGLELTNFNLGRGNGNLVKKIIKRSVLIHKTGIKLKINTVVNRLNYQEDLSWLIKRIKPERWKVFQILEIKNQNHPYIANLLISNTEFENFLNRHLFLKPIAETNQMMIESYLMIDPYGRFYQNTNNSYIFSRPIFKVGIESALNEITYNPKKYIQRGGLYAW
ncbi:MAG: viperin family antiviral radical SAM protein [Candidatus Lokiarchaeota archaeon]|nr:viperin family antiviral radical SAM protein [Candidatus Lokiarchaeota archaeon]